MVPESHVIDNILKQLKGAWNIEVAREMVNQQVQNMNVKLQIMNDLINTQSQAESPDMVEHQRKLKSQLVDLSLEDNKIVLDRLSKI